jgi:ABC-type ATPase involved in cell division/uncharacterized membrane protein YkoI
MSNYIEFKDVKKIYQMGEVEIEALSGVDFFIDKGEFVIIAGPSGAGKSTILNILGGMDTASSGKVIVDNNEITRLSRKELITYRRYDIGFVFQFYNLVQNLTAIENIELATQICKSNVDANNILDAVGLKDRKNNFPSQLSGGIKKMKSKKKLGIAIILAMAAIATFVGINLNQPAYAFTLDVNPSIEIMSNKLNKVVELNPLNDDAKELLKHYKVDNNSLNKVIIDLADLMVLKGYISGGKDNLVMISVDDDTVNQKVVDKLNKAIAAYLQNKQIEATIFNQAIPKNQDSKETVKEVVAKKINKLDDNKTYEELLKMSVKDLIEYAEERNITPQSLFDRIVRINKKDEPKDPNDIITVEKAKEIALELVDGEIVKFKLDKDVDDLKYEIEIISKANGKKYEIEIDAYTGKVLKFEIDNDDDKDDDKEVENDNKDNKNIKHNNGKSDLVSPGHAKQIAKDYVRNLAKGKVKIKDFELERDGDKAIYEIELKAEGKEYEIEMDAFTGKILKVEVDND